MKKTTNYTINFETETITITKKFGKAASQIGTPEFKEMKKLRNEFEGFAIEYRVIEKNEEKVSYKNLTFKMMESFIGSLPNSKTALVEFEKVKTVTNGEKGQYAHIKKWFLDNYKEQYKKWDITDLANTKKSEKTETTENEENVEKAA